MAAFDVDLLNRFNSIAGRDRTSTASSSHPHEASLVALGGAPADARRVRSSSLVGSVLRAAIGGALSSVLIGSMGLAAPAHADRVIRIRAQSRIEWDDAPAPSAVGAAQAAELRTLTGRLRDDTGAPLSQRSVEIVVRPEGAGRSVTQALLTDERGSFSLSLVDLPCPCDVEASFLGDLDLEGSSLRVTVDGVRAPVTLTATLPSDDRVSLDAPSHTIEIVARSAESAAGLAIAVENETGEAVAAGILDDAGRLRLELPSASLGPPAVGRLIIRSAPDVRHNAGATELSIVRYREARIGWLDAVESLRDEARLRGALTTTAGPLARRVVGIYLGDTHLSSMQTDARGEFEIPIGSGLARDAETLELTARYTADVPWLSDAISPTRTIRIDPRPRLLPWFALVSAIVFALFARSLLRRLPRGGAALEYPSAPGVTASLPSTILASAKEISGRLVRATTSEPIAGATIRCGDREVRTRDDGTFAFHPASGRHTLEADAPGYEAIHETVHVPHRGEWQHVVVCLESRRDIAARVLLDALTCVVPEGVPSHATFREMVEKAHGVGTAWPQLDALTRRVEDCVYSESVPSRDTLDAIRSEAARFVEVATRVDSKAA